MSSVVPLPPRYQPLAILGQGSFGEVRKVKDGKKRRPMALKCTQSSQEYFVNAALNEEFILKYLNEFDKQGFIVKLIRTEMYQGNHFMALELVKEDFGTWVDRMYPTGVPLSVMKTVCCRLFSGLCFLKELNIVHGDIKPNNFLMASDDPDSLKICDFGLARRLVTLRGVEIFPPDLGAIHFRSPDAILGYPSNYATDVWSTGLTLVYVVTTRYVFYCVRNSDLLIDMIMLLGMPPTELLKKAVRKSDYFSSDSDAGYVPKDMCDNSWKEPTGIQHLKESITEWTATACLPNTVLDIAAFYDLVRRMLTYNPARRLTPHQALKHPFLC